MAFERFIAWTLRQRGSRPRSGASRSGRRMGAAQEGILRKSFKRDGRLYDQVLYAILEEDWRGSTYTLPATRTRLN